VGAGILFALRLVVQEICRKSGAIPLSADEKGEEKRGGDKTE